MRKPKGYPITRDVLTDIFERDVDFSRRTIWLWDAKHSGMIDGVVSLRVVKALELMGGMGNKPIRLVINSGGGFIVHGMAIYNAILKCPVPVIAEVYGEAASVASIILQAADIRRAHVDASILIHDGYIAMETTPKTAEAHVEWNREYRKRTYEIYASRTGKSPEHFEKLCTQDTIYSAQRALGEGLIDEVISYQKKFSRNVVRRKNRG